MGDASDVAPSVAADKALACVAEGDFVVSGALGAQPRYLTAALGRRAASLSKVDLAAGMLLDLQGLDEVDSLRFRSGFPPRRGDDRSAWRIEYLSMSWSQVVQWLTERVSIDVLLLQVSRPDADGHHSFGVSASYTAPCAKVAKRVIAEVNPRMPYIYGARSHASELHDVISVEHPVPSFPIRQPTSSDSSIGEPVAPLIADHSTVQVGVGAVPDAVIGALSRRGARGLRIHSSATPRVVNLASSGCLSADEPSVVVGEVLGAQVLYDFVDRNPAVRLAGADTTHLASEAGAVLIRELARSANVGVENMRPGVLERHGLGYQTLVQANPGLVMLSMTMMGHGGPLRDLGGDAPVMSGLAGADAIVGYDERDLIGLYNPSPGDPIGATCALVSLLAALVRRVRTRKGSWVDVSQTATLLGVLRAPLIVEAHHGSVVVPGNTHFRHWPHGIYRCAGDDEGIAIAVRTGLGARTAARRHRQGMGDPRRSRGGSCRLGLDRERANCGGNAQTCRGVGWPRRILREHGRFPRDTCATAIAHPVPPTPRGAASFYDPVETRQNHFRWRTSRTPDGSRYRRRHLGHPPENVWQGLSRCPSDAGTVRDAMKEMSR